MIGAILTGDLIGSTDAPGEAVERAMSALAEAAAGISRWAPGADARFTRFRGDGWQVHVAEPGEGLRAALMMTSHLGGTGVGLGTRVAIGIGGIEHLGTDNLSDARGAAFEFSGRALDSMGRSCGLVIAGEGVGTLHRIVVDLLDERTTRWTRPQAEAMALVLHPDNPTFSSIARQLDISPQAVSYRLTGAGVSAIRRALRAWEDDWAFGGSRPETPL